MKVSLKSVLEQWTLYRRASEEINGYLMEGRYSVSRLQLLNGSLEAVQQQVESLEVSGAKEKWDILGGKRMHEVILVVHCHCDK